MKYYHQLYLDKYTALKKKQIIRKIEKNEWQMEIYVISLSKNAKNHLEIYNAAHFLQNGWGQREEMIVGFASGYNEALELVEKIVKEVYDNTKGTDIRKYILQKQELFEESNI